jgi:hypothetical protein
MAQALQTCDDEASFAVLFPGIAVNPAMLRLPACLVMCLAVTACGAEEDAVPDVSDGGVVADADVDTSDAEGVTDVSGGDADAEPETLCNGYAELCDRRFDEVVLLGTHNAMANAADGFIAPNHNLSIPDQLALGVRAMLIDVYREDEQLLLCHGSCGFGSSDAIAQLSGIVSFLNEHPNDVMAFIFEDRVDAADMATLVQASGLADMALLPPADGDWPTLREMIERGQRVVLTVESGNTSTPTIQPAWDVYFDTPYSFASVEEFSCELNRGSSENALFLMNHWVSNPLPDPFFAPDANAYDVLLGRAEACAAEQARLPHVIAVDFVEIGDAVEVVDVLNGVRPRR